MENSFDVPADAQPDWGSLLPREVFQEILLVLRGALPRPASGGAADGAAEARGRRDRTAMAAVASLLPQTAAEGRLAAQSVAADAWAMDCLRLAAEREPDLSVMRKCRAQAMSLMRESKSALRLLLRLQARREAAAAGPAAEQAAWVEHGLLRMMAGALEAANSEADAPRPSAPASAPAHDGGEAEEGQTLPPVASDGSCPLARPPLVRPPLPRRPLAGNAGDAGQEAEWAACMPTASDYENKSRETRLETAVRRWAVRSLEGA